jgi:hypothetical protein
VGLSSRSARHDPEGPHVVDLRISCFGPCGTCGNRSLESVDKGTLRRHRTPGRRSCPDDLAFPTRRRARSGACNGRIGRSARTHPPDRRAARYRSGPASEGGEGRARPGLCAGSFPRRTDEEARRTIRPPTIQRASSSGCTRMTEREGMPHSSQHPPTLGAQPLTKASALMGPLMPSRLERQTLEAYTIDRRDRGGKALGNLRALPRIRSKTIYAHALLFPSHEVLATRTNAGERPALPARWRAPIRWLVRGR